MKKRIVDYEKQMNDKSKMVVPDLEVKPAEDVQMAD
jgi:hypothetical protein